MSRCACSGSDGLKPIPSSEMPDPESMMIRLFSESLTSMQVVFPP
jgi:hypothetical protein